MPLSRLVMKEILFFWCVVPSLGSQILSFPCNLLYLLNSEEMFPDYVNHTTNVYIEILLQILLQ